MHKLSNRARKRVGPVRRVEAHALLGPGDCPAWRPARPCGREGSDGIRFPWERGVLLPEGKGKGCHLLPQCFGTKHLPCVLYFLILSLIANRILQVRKMRTG